ncbi:MAG: SPASM domain-containing protein, partial [Asgard group archaeon]|nr:SPASM domain-containing protein [Asgard group archaeon]
LVRDANYTPQNENRNLKCDGAVAYATITPSGEVLPCRFFDGVRAENVKSLPFRDIWYQSRFLNYFRSLRVSDLHGNCAKCYWLFRCAGSCRAFSFAEGDLFNGNKTCWAWLENEHLDKKHHQG